MIDKLRSCIDSVPAAIRSALLLAVMIATSIGLCLVFATPQDDPAERGEVIELPVADYSSAFFGLYAETLAETDGPMTLEDVIASDGWETMGTRYMSFGSVSDTIWIRARVRNISDAPITIRFDTRRVAFDHMDMYLTDPDGSGSTQFLDYSYAAPFSDRPVNHRFLVADIELAPNETQMAYVRFRGLFNTILPLRLASPEAFQMAEKHEVFWSAQFYGTFTAITFLTLLAAPLIGWRTSLSFGFFLITSAATCLAVEGYIDQHLIPDKNEITARLTDSLYFLTAAAILILSRTVFDLQAKARLLDFGAWLDILHHSPDWNLPLPVWHCAENRVHTHFSILAWHIADLACCGRDLGGLDTGKRGDSLRGQFDPRRDGVDRAGGRSDVWLSLWRLSFHHALACNGRSDGARDRYCSECFGPQKRA
ncbi:7TM-DISM domain-containing protein [Hyphomonas sp.]|uniref:7TMR-DISMED2 domain-containing protein n=1 Tax=Hyphomonas sp. TaxID=87 RepID=UPI001BCC1B49|nr:7TM-DISM domain-containing protein [Hyphomonas sp.]